MVQGKALISHRYVRNMDTYNYCQMFSNETNPASSSLQLRTGDIGDIYRFRKYCIFQM